MRNLILTTFLILLSVTALGQGATNYPGSLDTTTTLPQASDFKITYLTSAASSGATTITVNSTASVPTSGVLQIDSELLSYTTSDSTHFTVTRAFTGTTAAAHTVFSTVHFPLVSAHVNGLRGAMLALEAKLGIGSSDAASAVTGQVLTKQSGGTTIWATPASGESPLTFNAPLTRSVNSISITQADTTHNGYLTSTDWSIFNGKQNALGYTPLNPANNLSDVASVPSARTNLGLGTAATKDVAASGNASSSQVVKGDDTRLSDARAPVTYTADGTVVTGAHIVTGGVGLSGGTGTLTFSGSAVFTSSTTYQCTGSNFSATNGFRIDKTSGSLITVTGTGSDVIVVICIGN
ncbi:MAG: hypothetical protein QOH63_1997 [Acidobacteriota bacterium]|jgi:hypothetical protein|nr:hypothetical protein [Acidobacteriota bacterium]